MTTPKDDGDEKIPINLEHLAEAFERVEEDVNIAMWENEQ